MLPVVCAFTSTLLKDGKGCELFKKVKVFPVIVKLLDLRKLLIATVGVPWANWPAVILGIVYETGDGEAALTKNGTVILLVNVVAPLTVGRLKSPFIYWAGPDVLNIDIFSSRFTILSA